MSSRLTHGIRVLTLLAAVLATACAGTPPKPKFARAIAADAHVAVSDATQVTVETGDKVEMLASEKARLAEKIQARIESRKAQNAGSGAGRNYEVKLHLTRYQKGNAFARAMMAGLGQIHIDGNVELLQLPERNPVGEFDLAKTFAWGGIYGSAKNIEDIENTFADGVAAAVTGQQPQEPKKADSKADKH